MQNVILVLSMVMALPFNSTAKAEKYNTVEKHSFSSALVLDSMVMLTPGNWENSTSQVVITSFGGGYVNGTNEYGDLAKAEVFKVDKPYTILGAYYWIGDLSGEVGNVNFNIWSFEGEPQNILASKSISMAELSTSVSFTDPYYVEFDTPLEVSSDYLIGLDFNDIQSSEIALVSSDDGQGGGLDLVWEQWSDMRWYPYSDNTSWLIDIDLGIFPYVNFPVENNVFEQGNGTAGDPYQIANATQLYRIRDYPDAQFIQIADIDLGQSQWQGDIGWDAIGTLTKPFTGTYDGNGHSIINLTIQKSTLDYQGLFSFLNNASVKNLHLEAVNISGHRHVGALAGIAENSTIQNIFISGDVSGADYIGGLVGLAFGQANLLASSFQGIVTGENFIGGLVGQLGTDAKINECFTMGTVNGGRYTGGLSGELSNQVPKTYIGPEGVTLVFPAGSVFDERDITFLPNDGQSLTRTGEVLASPAVEVSLNHIEVMMEPLAEGEAIPVYELIFPITIEEAQNENLRVRLRIDSETRYPIYGNYDPASKNYTVYVFGLVDGWQMAVIDGDPVVRVSALAKNESAALRSPSDWKTYDFEIYDDSDQSVSSNILTEDQIQQHILPIARDALINFSNMAYKSPKLRTVENKNAFKMVLINSDVQDHNAISNSSYYYAPDRLVYTGGIYIFYPTYITDFSNPASWDLKFVISHEIFHSIQFAYDYKTDSAPSAYFGKPASKATCYEEGTATLVGGTYDIHGTLDANKAIVYPFDAPMILSVPFDDINYNPYSKQDFFAFISKRYSDGGLAFLGPMWQKIAAFWPEVDYTKLNYFYRLGMDDYLKSIGFSLPWAYTEFAFQRLIIHDSEYLLRTSETPASNPEFTPYLIAKSLLTAGSYKNWKSNKPDVIEYDVVKIDNIGSCASAAVDFSLPSELDVETRPDSVYFIISLSNNAKIEPQLDKEGVRIAIYRKSLGQLVANEPTILVDDISKPVAVSIKDDVTDLAFVIINAYLDDKITNLSISMPSEGTVLNVTKNKRYQTIQAAINEASNGDEIKVFPNTYLEAINFSDKIIYISSDQGPQETIIDGTGNAFHLGALISSGLDFAPSLTGFTFQNWQIGVGVYNVGDGTVDPLIENNVFVNNESAIYSINASPRILSNQINHNGTGDDESIIYSSKGNPLIEMNNIVDNKGVGIDVSGDAIIRNNTISRNEARTGAGISINNGSPQITNNIISDNLADQGAGILIWDGAPIISNNRISKNIAKYSGGGMYIGSPGKTTLSTITNNTIEYNEAGQEGGGINCFWCGGNIDNNTIQNNTGRNGGGLYLHQSSVTIIGNQFNSNHATDNGGGIAGFAIGGWEPTAWIIDNTGASRVVYRHTPCFEEPANSYNGNSHGMPFEGWGPGTNNWCTNAGFHVFIR